ncbi:hypothetical protein [Sphingomonas aquatilis]
MSIKQRVRRALARLGYYRPVAGDVVLDRYDGVEKTVSYVTARRVHVHYFRGGKLFDATLLRRSIGFVR